MNRGDVAKVALAAASDVAKVALAARDVAKVAFAASARVVAESGGAS